MIKENDLKVVRASRMSRPRSDEDVALVGIGMEDCEDRAPCQSKGNVGRERVGCSHPLRYTI